MVGHSQVPQELEVPGVDLRIFRAPGGTARTFFTNDRLNNVLEWEHDWCILWLGSNDVYEEAIPRQISDHIFEIVREIERRCKAKVRIC